MNETIKVLKERRSCRKFKEDMITNEELESVLEAGTYAPTGNGKQSPIIIAITNKKIRDELSLENRKVGNMPEGFDPFYNAPVILAVLADKSVKTYLYVYLLRLLQSQNYYLFVPYFLRHKRNYLHYYFLNFLHLVLLLFH